MFNNFIMQRFTNCEPYTETVLDFVGGSENFNAYITHYFKNNTLVYYNLQPDNWYGIFERIAYHVLLNPMYQNTDIVELGMTIYSNYYQKWEHLATLFLKEYNPIENYSMTENMLDFTEDGGTKDDFTAYSEKQQGNSASGQTSRSGKIVSEISVSDGNVSITTADGVEIETEHYTTTMDDTTTDRKQYKDKNKGTSTAETLNGFYNETTKDGDVNHIPNKLDKQITDTITETEIDTTNIRGHKGNRSGNIGVTTTQQMAMSEIDYAQYINLARIICADVCDFLSAGVYGYDT